MKKLSIVWHFLILIIFLSSAYCKAGPKNCRQAASKDFKFNFANNGVNVSRVTQILGRIFQNSSVTLELKKRYSEKFLVIFDDVEWGVLSQIRTMSSQQSVFKNVIHPYGGQTHHSMESDHIVIGTKAWEHFTYPFIHAHESQHLIDQHKKLIVGIDGGLLQMDPSQVALMFLRSEFRAFHREMKAITTLLSKAELQELVTNETMQMLLLDMKDPKAILLQRLKKMLQFYGNGDAWFVWNMLHQQASIFQNLKGRSDDVTRIQVLAENFYNGDVAFVTRLIDQQDSY